MTATLLIHAGAGPLSDELLTHRGEIADALRSALAAGGHDLERGAAAEEAAESAVRVLEDFPLFNAGVGATLCADGTVELSAGIMRGVDRAAGAVAGMRHTRNPIGAARLVLELAQVLMVGAAADELAAAAGQDQQANEAFITEYQRVHPPPGSEGDRGTVGAVCVDGSGRLAAATSTGGVRGQPRGRVGDAPLIGAGTWADERVAVSCTGDGEAFIRVGVSHLIAMLAADGAPLAAAADRALAEVAKLGHSGGLIAVDGDGSVAVPFITPAMPRGMVRAGEAPVVWVAGEDPEPTA